MTSGSESIFPDCIWRRSPVQEYEVLTAHTRRLTKFLRSLETPPFSRPNVPLISRVSIRLSSFRTKRGRDLRALRRPCQPVTLMLFGLSVRPSVCLSDYLFGLPVSQTPSVHMCPKPLLSRHACLRAHLPVPLENYEKHIYKSEE